MTISIELGEKERSIVTPDLRLRFTRLDDRWSHAIDVGPGPWKVAAESVEWEFPHLSPPSYGPTFQEVQFQPGKDEVLALALGQAGPHHFSASFRVHRREWECDHFRDPSILQKRSESLVVIDIADRCRSAVSSMQARYTVGAREQMVYLGGSNESPGTKERGGLAWEIYVPNNYHLYLKSEEGPTLPPSLVTIAERSCGEGWDVGVAPCELSTSGTNRLVYTWSHHRVKVFHKSTGGIVE